MTESCMLEIGIAECCKCRVFCEYEQDMNKSKCDVKNSNHTMQTGNTMNLFDLSQGA